MVILLIKYQSQQPQKTSDYAAELKQANDIDY